MLQKENINSPDCVNLSYIGLGYSTRMRGFFNFKVMEKVCGRCKVIKPVDQFFKNKSRKNGLECFCKECSSNASRIYGLTVKGVISVIYRNQRCNSKQRKHPPPAYTKKEFTKLCMGSPDFIRLYNNWVNSGYKKHLKPSFDRASDNEGYSFTNFNKWMTWEDNNQKARDDIRSGKLTNGHKPHKPVIGTHTVTGDVISFHSGKEAERQTGTHQGRISLVCSGKGHHAGGYSWKFKEDK